MTRDELHEQTYLVRSGLRSKKARVAFEKIMDELYTAKDQAARLRGGYDRGYRAGALGLKGGTR